MSDPKDDALYLNMLGQMGLTPAEVDADLKATIYDKLGLKQSKNTSAKNKMRKAEEKV